MTVRVDQRTLVSREEAAVRFGISVGTVDRLRRAGRLGAYRLGRRVLIDPEELTQALAPERIEARPDR